MKNYWIDKKKGGFPQDDELSIQAGCCGDFVCNCSANLDIYYGSQFVQNEVLQVLDKSKYGVTIYATEFTPVYAGTMFGTIAFEGCDVFKFCFSESGLFILTRIGEDKPVVLKADESLSLEESDRRSLQALAYSDLPIYTYYEGVYSGELNLVTGEFKLVWDACEAPVVTVCYEFARA
jgi:hypothetical protein